MDIDLRGASRIERLGSGLLVLAAALFVAAPALACDCALSTPKQWRDHASVIMLAQVQPRAKLLKGYLPKGKAGKAKRYYRPLMVLRGKTGLVPAPPVVMSGNKCGIRPKDWAHVLLFFRDEEARRAGDADVCLGSGSLEEHLPYFLNYLQTPAGAERKDIIDPKKVDQFSRKRAWSFATGKERQDWELIGILQRGWIVYARFKHKTKPREHFVVVRYNGRKHEPLGWVTHKSSEIKPFR